MSSPLLVAEKCPSKVGTVEVSIRGKWTHVPALEVNGKAIVVRGKRIKMAVINEEEWLDDELEDPELCVQKLKEKLPAELRADIFNFTQKVPGSVPRYPYPMEAESVAAIRLTTFKEWWEKLPQEGRKNVRRSQKRGVVVSVRPLDDDLIRGIVGVNNDSPIRQNVPFAHYGKTFEQVKKDQSSFLDRSDFICAHAGDELVGFLKMVHKGQVASILQLLPKASHADKRPGNALVAKAVEVCELKGVSFLTYGLYNYGKKRDNPLREFKARNGFEEIFTPRFYIPLTTWGKFCMKLKLHRGLIGILPHHLIVFAVGVRAKWYNLKNFMGRCSSMLERSNSDRQMGRSNPPAGSNP